MLIFSFNFIQIVNFSNFSYHPANTNFNPWTSASNLHTQLYDHQKITKYIHAEIESFKWIEILKNSKSKVTLTARRPSAKALPFSTSCSYGFELRSPSLKGGAWRCFTRAGTAPPSTITFTTSSAPTQTHKIVYSKQYKNQHNARNLQNWEQTRKNGNSDEIGGCFGDFVQPTVLSELGEDVRGALSRRSIGFAPRERRVEDLHLLADLAEQGLSGFAGLHRDLSFVSDFFLQFPLLPLPLRVVLILAPLQLHQRGQTKKAKMRRRSWSEMENFWIWIGESERHRQERERECRGALSEFLKKLRKRSKSFFFPFVLFFSLSFHFRWNVSGLNRPHDFRFC